MRRAAASLLVAVLATVGVACGDDDTDGTDRIGAEDPSTTNTTTPPDESSPSTTTTPTTTTAVAPAATVSLVSQNLLHGLACAPETDGCDLAARVALFLRQLDEAGCPAVVSVQEANQEMVDLLVAGSASSCGGGYEIVWDDDEGIDREVVLTTAEVVDHRRLPLPGGFRTAYWVRVVSGGGLLEVVSTHLASGSDDRPCDGETCPPPCLPDDRLNTCQARTVLAAIDELADPASTVVLTGDLNAAAGSPTIDAVEEAGFVDTHLAVGRPECDPATGASCTSGRDDATLTDLTDPASRQGERIDFVFVRPGGPCTVDDAGLFNAEPAADDPAGLAFPSDHTAVFATLACTGAGEVDVTTATLPPTTTTAAGAGAGPADPATAAAVTEAFTALFGGAETDVEVKLSYLEDAELLRPFFVASYEANQAIASQISVRVDSVVLGATGEATVVFALLLDDAVVVGPTSGRAVLVGGRWLVARQTYCGLSAAGAEELPEPCR